MGLCFRKSITLFKGVRLNLSKSGPSLSFGGRGMRQSINLNGKTRTTVGIPGTGLYYTKSGNVKNLVGGGDKKTVSKPSTRPSGVRQDTTSRDVVNQAVVNHAVVNQDSAGAAKVRDYENRVEAIKSVHRQSDGYIDWAAIKASSSEYPELAPFAESILAGDIDSYFKVIAEVAPFDDLLEYGSAFEVGTDDPSILEVEFKVKADEVVPKTVVSLKADGSISEKEMTKTAYYDLVRDYVSSVILRVVRDSFALLPIETCVIHAVDTILNPATGNDEEAVLVSAKIHRSDISAINFERIDPSDCLTSFECNEKFRKTAGYAPVERILPV